MKKTLLFLSTAFAINAFGQSSILLTNTNNNQTLSPNEIIYMNSIVSDNVKVIIDVKNTNTVSAKTYNVVRYNVALNTDASAYYCFGGNCYGDQTFVCPNPLTLNPNQSASGVAGSFNMLTADLDEGPALGFSHIKYTFFNTANTSDSVQISIKYNANPTGIKEVSKTSVSFDIFPNPAKETANLVVNSPKSSESLLVVYNSIGELVSQKAVSLNEGKNKVEVSLSGMRSGVYFASIKTGNSVISKKLIVE